MPPQILIVEDDASLADMLALAFRDAGFGTSVAHDGEAGLAAARREDVDGLATAVV